MSLKIIHCYHTTESMKERSKEELIQIILDFQTYIKQMEAADSDEYEW